MKYLQTCLILCLLPFIALAYTDESHFSKTFNSTRIFRVFTPVNYDPENATERYPVIYFFHGCGGSYERSGAYSYKDYGLTPPIAVDRLPDSAYAFANNADFENVSSSKGVIIICIDGKINGLGGCGVYFPSLAKSWKGNYYDFSAYVRELIPIVDARYNTISKPAFRAVTGLSMGGQMAIWIAATNPSLFSSASQFCHSPNFYDVGEPAYQTTVDVKELWRNLRGIPFRHATTDRDYLRYYTDQLFSIFQGAGFPNEYYIADHCHHAAARVDLQVDFHLNHFSTGNKEDRCFSYINLYPDFSVKGYQVSSNKSGNGWIYLNNVTTNGLGVYTRKRLPWGQSLPPFEISIYTPGQYNRDQEYMLARYSYRHDSFQVQTLNSDSLGKILIKSRGGAGDEIGILGDDLPPPIFILLDTVNENIYLDQGVPTPLSVDVINLSLSTQHVDFIVTTESPDLLVVSEKAKSMTIRPLSKLHIDTLVILEGNARESSDQTYYIKIQTMIAGIIQEREQILQVKIRNSNLSPGLIQLKVFDGRTEELSLFKYQWNGWRSPLSSGRISEGSGNGNGIIESGETFSIWMQTETGFDPNDLLTWHPTIPVSEADNADIVIEEIKHHSFSTGRDVLSAQMRLQRIPTQGRPVKIPIRSEFLKVEPLQNDCHRNSADNFTHYYTEVLLFSDGTLTIH